MYRSQIITKKKITVQVGTYRHLGKMFYHGYSPRGVPMPVAIAIGTDPLVAMASVTDMAAYVDEADAAGGLRKEPVKLVKCETSDLYVPANSEIVLEGRCMPFEVAEEGPHGEYHGWRVSERGKVERPLMRLDAITFRNNPILTFSNMGFPTDDSHTTASLSQSGALLQHYRRSGLPVTGAFVPPWGPWGCVIVATKKPYAYIVHEIASATWSNPVGRVIHYLIALDETANPYDASSVLHEITFKCHPVRGMRSMEQGPGGVLDPYLTAYERHFNLGAAGIIDCTTPYEWDFPPIEARFSNPHLYPEDIQKKVLGDWEKYGLEES
jgi:4-hydroxy-3-polyprenylbenzoate decarboxylase